MAAETIRTILSLVALAVSIYALLFTLWKEKKQEVMKLFVKLPQDAQAFRLAFLDHVSALKKRPATISANTLTSPGLRVEAEQRMKQFIERADISNRNLHNCIAVLRSDCTAVGLLFDARGDDLGKAIESLYANTAAVLPANDLSIGEWEGVLNPLIYAVEQNMKPLWNWLDKSWSGFFESPSTISQNAINVIGDATKSRQLDGSLVRCQGFSRPLL